jgi:peptide/nickel transport system permease protein
MTDGILALAALPRGRAQRIRLGPLAIIGAAIIGILALVAVLAPWLAPSDPAMPDLGHRLEPSSVQHWLGTDPLGRDTLSRLVFGTRLTLVIVAVVSAIAGPLGLLVGLIAGYFGGWVDALLMRLTDVFMAFPRLLLALAVAAALGPGLGNAIVAIAVTSWPAYARVARVEARTVRRADFIAAARLKGAGPLRIITRHIAPLCLSSLLTRMTFDMAGVILVAAGLGFLGLGAQPPASEWGMMVAAGRDVITEQWWVSTIPGAAIFFASLGFSLLGDGLRDALDPRLR